MNLYCGQRNLITDIDVNRIIYPSKNTHQLGLYTSAAYTSKNDTNVGSILAQCLCIWPNIESILV